MGARKSTARRTHLIFLEECKVARSTKMEVAANHFLAARQTTPSASLAPRARARKSTARRTHLLEVARSTGTAARHTMPSASLASRASARKSSARRTHLLIFLEECKVARSTTREMAVRAAARHSLQTA